MLLDEMERNIRKSMVPWVPWVVPALFGRKNISSGVAQNCISLHAGDQLPLATRKESDWFSQDRFQAQLAGTI